MSEPITLVVKEPKSCGKVQLQDFIAFARTGGEVGEAVLEDRVRNAKCLVFLFQGPCLRGIAALKNPLASYRRSVSSKTGVKLEASEFPYELGYVFVLPSTRGAHL